MRDQRLWFAGTLLAIGCFVLGQWSSGRTVRAEGEDVQFQFHGVDAQSGLLVYYGSQKTLYVYQGVMTGNSALQCSYRLKMGDPGGVIRRESCPVQRLIP